MVNLANRVLTETYPTVAPRGAPENDYERIPTSPAMFGGLIAQGEEKAGQGLEAASSAAASVQGFYSQVTASDAYNKLDDAYHKMQFGDPNDPNNPGFYALKGQNALSARGGVEQQMEDTRQQLKTGLNPYARLMFEQDSRRLQAMTLSNIGRHADQQFDEYATSTATATQANAVRRAGTFADDDSAYVDAAQSGAKAIGALAKARGSSPDELEKMTNDFQTAMVQSRVEGLITTDPVRAKTFLDAHKDQINPAIYDQLSSKLVEPFAQGANAQAADAVAKGWRPRGTAASGDYGPTFTKYNQFLNGGDVQSALRLSEGLRTNAYWDVNHWRTGYGSDTVTRADGSVENVTATTQITPADAERDLQRRTALASQTAQSQVGEAWNNMTPGARSALTSVVYNYGHLPGDIATAAASGNSAALAGAIASHAHDNEGVNSQRRMAEAGAVSGTFGLRGPMGTASPQPSMMMPQDQNFEPGQATQTAAIGETPQPAAFTIEPPTTPGTPIGAARTPDDDLATRVQYIEAQNWSPEIKNAAIGMAERDYKLAAIAAGQSDKEKKDRKEAAINDVEGYVLKGDYAGAFKKMNSYGDDQITNQEKLALQDVIERRSGEPSPTSYGPKYSEMFKHVIAPDGDPQRIGDITSLYQAEANGDLTAKGTERLKTVMTDVRKNTDEYGLQREVAGVYDFAKQRLDFSIDEPFLKVPDPKGRSVFDLEFTTMFNSQLDAWRKTGKDVSQFPLFQRDKLNQMLDILRPKAQMDRERMAAVGETAQAPEPAGAPLPPAPSGVDQTKWSPLVSAPPGGLNHAQWGMALNDLVTKQDVGVFNASKFGQSGLRGEDILNRLGIAYAPPGKPEGVGAETPSALQAPVPPTPEQARAQRAEEEKRKAPLPSAQTPEAASVTSKIGDFLKSLPHIGEPHLTEKK